MKKFKYFIIIGLLLTLIMAPGCTAGSKDTISYKKPAKVNADVSRQLLIEGNNRYKEGKTQPKKVLSAKQAQGKKPIAVIIACSDAYVPPEILFDQGVGDLLVVRTVGHVLDPIALASVEYGVEHCKAPLVVVMGHTNCAAIEEAVTGHSCPGNIPLISEKLKPAVEVARGSGATGQALYEMASTNNILNVLDELDNSKVINEFKGKAGLKVIGLKYHIENGQIEWFDGGCDLAG